MIRFIFRATLAVLLPAVLVTSARSQEAAREWPEYDIAIRLQGTAPRLRAEAVIRLPPSSEPGFVLGQMFRIESIEVGDADARQFRPAAADSTYVRGPRATWGTVRWRLREPSAVAARSIRVRYRLDGEVTTNVFGVNAQVTFGSGINTAWYPQIEPPRTDTSARLRPMRGTGTLRFEAPRGVTVYSVGEPRDGTGGFTFRVSKPALFNFAAGAYTVRLARAASKGAPPVVMYYLKPRENAEEYATKSLAVIRALSEEFGPYMFDRFALVEVPGALADSAGFAGASVEGGIFSIASFLDPRFNVGYYGHEFGHQWWGVTIRPSGARGAWLLAEGMAQYGALRAIEAVDGAAMARTFRIAEYPDYFGQGGALYFKTVGEGHDAPLADLPNTEQWSRLIVNSKGFMAMHALSNEMGRERLRAAFRDILTSYRERRLVWDDFTAALNHAAGRDMGWFYEQWFYRTGAPELSAEVRDTTVVIRSWRDDYRLPLELALFGSRCPPRMSVRADGTTTVPLPRGCRADSVVVDPDYHVLRWPHERRP